MQVLDLSSLLVEFSSDLSKHILWACLAASASMSNSMRWGRAADYRIQAVHPVSHCEMLAAQCPVFRYFHFSAH